MMKTLLPPGCYDVLPPFARAESQLSGVLLDVFAAYGYAQVAPPLLEYSDNLLAGRGAKLSSQMFRVMDASANRVMAIRPDITLQIARIAGSVLKDAPRPLRLCYNGLILRQQGEQLKNDRQLRQAGIELIGAGSPAADAEVILVAGRALAKAGITHFTIDVNLPGIVAAIVAEDALSPDDVEALYSALSHKNASALETLPLKYKDALVALLTHCGDAGATLKAIETLKLPQAASDLCEDLREVTAILEAQKEPGCTITVDVTESQNYSYHSGVGFSIFVPGVAYEVGRGGRYRAGDEDATGFTLYVETLLSLLAAPKAQEKVLVAPGTPKAECEALQAKGYVTMYALAQDRLKEQAAHMGCSQVFEGGKLVKL